MSLVLDDWKGNWVFFIIHDLLHTQSVPPGKSASSAGSLYPPMKLLKPERWSVSTVDATPNGILCHWEHFPGLHRLPDQKAATVLQKEERGLQVSLPLRVHPEFHAHTHCSRGSQSLAPTLPAAASPPPGTLNDARAWAHAHPLNRKSRGRAQQSVF